ncbi:MAG: kynureninase, partial [Saprospiraceae bacterium]|nr:kynureninase [Saprospiraceae bacterium]MDW8485386.1 kynureninase [Saprospiraceae bacterium]
DLAWLVGAKPAEVVAMNGLTANLHLLLASFYRPRAERKAILIERGAFPSDRYAAVSQIRFHGLDPAEALIEIEPDEPAGTFSPAHLLAEIERHAERLALVLLPGVQYRSGEVFPVGAVAALARRIGCPLGLDLAHAIGNVPLSLHDDGVDFAVWCSYKYLNAGPGAIAGAFVHERHHGNEELPRLAGWWGHRPDDRFAMPEDFRAAPGAEAWALSNPPILALAPLRVSLAIFREAGIGALREKSLALSGRLREEIVARFGERIEVLTPLAPERRGAQ